MSSEYSAQTLCLLLPVLALAYGLSRRFRVVVELLRAWLSKNMWRRSYQSLVQHWHAGRTLIKEQKWEDALIALERALSLVEHDLGLKPELEFHKGYALEQMGRSEEAITAYVACQLTESGRKVPKYRPVAGFRQGYLLAQLNRWEEAELSLRTSAKEAERLQLSSLRLNAMRILLGVYQAMHRHTQALQCARELASLARAQRDESMEALTLDVEGDIYQSLGQPTEALYRYEQSLDLFRKLGNNDAESVVKRDIARLYQTSGQWERALRWLAVWLQEEQRAENWGVQARIAYDLACLHIHTGHLIQAGGYLQHSMAMFRRAEDRSGADMVGRTLMGLSILLHRRATADWLTFGDIKRGSARLNGDDEE